MSARRTWLAIAACAAVVASVTTACGGATGRSSRRPVPNRPCAWAVRADKQTLNIAYPDTAATYWVLGYDLAPGESLRLSGRFPSARYMSFISYGPVGGVVDVVTDREIAPDRGSTNPFVGSAHARTAARDYTISVRAGSPVAGSTNVVWAGTTTAVPPGIATSPADPSIANRLGSGGTTGVHGTVLYRVYLSDRPGDRTGGEGLPTVTVVSADGRRTPVTTCAAPAGSASALETVQRYGPPTDTPAPEQPTFMRPESVGRLFPDPDNVYIAAVLHYVPGRIAVIEAKAPTFPDPARGRPIGQGEQVRYWSMCTNEYRKPYPVTACVADRDTVLDSSGRYRFVVSTPADRPVNATAANGVTWLDWGSTKVDLVLLLRHMLAAPDFVESAIFVKPGAAATSSMGEYAPRGVYCETSAFEHGDASCNPG